MKKEKLKYPKLIYYYNIEIIINKKTFIKII